MVFQKVITGSALGGTGTFLQFR